ncbi:hypothetical protein ZWY2020_054703 [Hordeum vulgare]|nr:hypothetical protein ZWY2020_054703 [Hordeum vulgare]
MGDYLARFREHVYVVCAGEWKPPPQKRSSSSHGTITIDSIYYYGKSLYQDVKLISYFSSIRPPMKLAFGFRLGRCIILHFPKRTFIHFFLPGRSPRLKQKQDNKSRPVLQEKGWWPTFGKFGTIGCLHSSEGTHKERNEMRGRGQGKESSRSTGRSKTKSEFGRKRCNVTDTMTHHHQERRILINHFG